MTKQVWSKRVRKQRREAWLREKGFFAERPRSAQSEPVRARRIAVEYYWAAFTWLHLQIDQRYPTGIAHGMSVRRGFWHLVPDGIYSGLQAQELVCAYASAVERRLSDEIGTHSFAYWLHVYRRIAPEYPGPNKSETTTMLVRERLESAFQKYAKAGDDPAIQWNNQIKPEQVFPSVPEKYRLPNVIEGVLRGPRQQVLTSFGIDELIQTYKCEQMAYELWKCGAMARIVSKGAELIVDHTLEECVVDNRSHELNELVTHYDARAMPFIASSTASVFGQNTVRSAAKGWTLLARYNVERSEAEAYSSFFADVDIGVAPDFKFNFTWFPFDLADYVSAHAWLSDRFFRKHGFHFQTALIILLALFRSMMQVWLSEPMYMAVAFNRGYTGPSKLPNVRRIVGELAEKCARELQAPTPSAEELDSALRFLTLSEDKKGLVSVITGGPLFPFVQTGEEEVIVDFAWQLQQLHYLFLGLPLTDKGAKGRLLESLVSAGQSVLPDERCKGRDGTSKEVDAAFRFGHVLVIAECKANARSIAYDRGDLAALQYRRRAFEEALRQVDQKALWFSEHVVGTNFDITGVEAILPVVVTPFKEFIPSLDSMYWVDDATPRVMMPDELRELLNNQDLDSIVRNCKATVFVPKLVGAIKEPRFS